MRLISQFLKNLRFLYHEMAYTCLLKPLCFRACTGSSDPFYVTAFEYILTEH